MLLDRIARDLEHAYLIRKPGPVDPLAFPWLFLAEGGDNEGADRLKFQSRARRPRADSVHESDLETVAYWLVPADPEPGFSLLRWSSPVLPDGLDRSFPRRDDPGVQVLAEPLARFAVRLRDDAGEWTSEWDSSTLLRSGKLPVEVELQVAWLPDGEGEAEERFVRRVALPVRPLDLEAALQQGGGNDEEQAGEEQEAGECVTVAQCIERNPDVFEQFLSSVPDRAAVQAVIDSIRDQCFRDTALDVQVEGCQ